MQNKAKVKMGKMNISIVIIKDYDKNNEQLTTNVIQNKAKQSQLVKTGTRPKTQILSLKSGVWKGGRKAEKVDFLHGQKIQSKKN